MSCLLLDNDDVRALLPVEDCVALVERAYADLDAGTAAGPPRTNLALPAGPGREYVLKCWQCADPRSGLAAVRLVSEVLEPFTFAGRVVHGPLAVVGGREVPARAVLAGDAKAQLTLQESVQPVPSTGKA